MEKLILSTIPTSTVNRLRDPLAIVESDSSLPSRHGYSSLTSFSIWKFSSSRSIQGITAFSEMVSRLSKRSPPSCTCLVFGLICNLMEPDKVAEVPGAMEAVTNVSPSVPSTGLSQSVGLTVIWARRVGDGIPPEMDVRDCERE